MYRITKYQHLKKGHVYRIFNSIEGSETYLYEGYYFNEEIQDHVLILSNPTMPNIGYEMDCQEFKGAVDEEETQADYRRMCDSVADNMHADNNGLIPALIGYESVGIQSFLKVLHCAGKTIQTFEDDVLSRSESNKKGELQ